MFTNRANDGGPDRPGEFVAQPVNDEQPRPRDLPGSMPGVGQGQQGIGRAVGDQSWHGQRSCPLQLVPTGYYCGKLALGAGRFGGAFIQLPCKSAGVGPVEGKTGTAKGLLGAQKLDLIIFPAFGPTPE